MAHYHTACRSPMPAEEVFQYLSRFSNGRHWDPGVDDATDLDEGSPGPGCRYRLDVRFGSRTLPLVYETREFDPAAGRVVLEAATSWLRSTDQIRVVPAEGGGCRVDYDARLVLRGPARLLDPVLGVAFTRIGDRAAAGLREALAGSEA